MSIKKVLIITLILTLVGGAWAFSWLVDRKDAQIENLELTKSNWERTAEILEKRNKLQEEKIKELQETISELKK